MKEADQEQELFAKLLPLRLLLLLLLGLTPWVDLLVLVMAANLIVRGIHIVETSIQQGPLMLVVDTTHTTNNYWCPGGRFFDGQNTYRCVNKNVTCYYVRTVL